MNIRDEEQLQQYFERQMSGSQEQNFLINVAARDDMRLAFRSQLELLKAVREDKDTSGSPTFVRSKTLGALGLGGALLPGSLKEQEAQAASLSPKFLQRIGTAFRRPAISIATGLVAGILGTSFFVSASPDNAIKQPASGSIPAIQAPTVQQPQISTPPLQTATPAENRAYKSHGTNRANNTDRETPITNSSKPGSVNVHNNITKPESPGQK